MRSEQKKTVVATRGTLRKNLATTATAQAAAPNRTRSTSGEIHTIGAETCSIAPQLRQFRRWKRRRSAPSIRPVKVANGNHTASIPPKREPSNETGFLRELKKFKISLGRVCFSAEVFYRNASEHNAQQGSRPSELL